MTTNWSEEKHDALTPVERKAENPLRALPDPPVPVSPPKIDRPLTNQVEVESLPTASYIQRKSRFVAGGLPVHCPHCRAEEFIEGSALLSTAGISFVHLNWATEKKDTNLMCDNCGLIQWFGTVPLRR